MYTNADARQSAEDALRSVVEVGAAVPEGTKASEKQKSSGIAWCTRPRRPFQPSPCAPPTKNGLDVVMAGRWWCCSRGVCRPAGGLQQPGRPAVCASADQAQPALGRADAQPKVFPVGLLDLDARAERIEQAAQLLGLNPLHDTWLGAKLLLLLAYIVLGSFALKRARRCRPDTVPVPPSKESKVGS